MTFGERQPQVEDDFGGRRPLVEDSRCWKTTFGMKDDLRWKATYGGRRLSVEDNLCWKKTYDYT